MHSQFNSGWHNPEYCVSCVCVCVCVWLEMSYILCCLLSCSTAQSGQLQESSASSDLKLPNLCGECQHMLPGFTTMIKCVLGEYDTVDCLGMVPASSLLSIKSNHFYCHITTASLK